MRRAYTSPCNVKVEHTCINRLQTVACLEMSAGETSNVKVIWIEGGTNSRRDAALCGTRKTPGIWRFWSCLGDVTRCNVHQSYGNVRTWSALTGVQLLKPDVPVAAATCFSIVWATAPNVCPDFGGELTFLKTCTFPEQLTVKFTHAPSEGEISFDWKTKTSLCAIATWQLQ